MTTNVSAPGEPAESMALKPAPKAGGVSAAVDPSTWAVRWGRGRKRALLVAVQVPGEAGIIAASVLLAYVLFASWPQSMGAVQRNFLNTPWLLAAALRSPEFATCLPLFLLAPVVHLLLFQWLGLYRPSLGDTRPFAPTITILKGAVAGTAVILMLAYAYQTASDGGDRLPPLFFLYQLILAFFGVLVCHAATLIGLLILQAFGWGRTRVAVLRAARDPADLIDALQSPTTEYNLVGTITLSEHGTEKDKPSGALGQIEALRLLINRHDLDEVILALDPGALSVEQRLEVARACWEMGVELKMITPFQPFFRTSAHPERIGNVSLLHVENLGLYATWPQILKRALDIAVSLAALIALSPLLVLTAIIIKLDSPGPVFFVQERVGLNGRTFRMFKFRSMRSDASKNAVKHQEYTKKLIQGDAVHEVDEAGEAIYKIARDPRVTRIGWFIRKTSIDELPQLINALRGDMSLVGPRPPIQYEVDEYQDWHMRRLHIRPGITGLWQVSGRNRLSFEQMVRLDIAYLEQWSLWFDVKILLRTIPVILKIDQGF